MNKKLKQIAASLLSVLMIICFMPSMAFAAEESVTWEVQTAIPDQEYTGEIPDLMSVPELATIEVKDANSSSSSEVLTMQRGKDFEVEALTAGPGVVTAVFKTKGTYANDTINPVPFNVKEAQSTDKYEVTIDTSKIVYDGDPLNSYEVAAASSVKKNGNQTIYYYGSSEEEQCFDVEVVDEITNAGEKSKVEFYVTGVEKPIYETEVTIGKRDLSTLTMTGEQKTALTYNADEQTTEFNSIEGTCKLVDEDGDEFTVEMAIPADDYEITGYKDNVNAGSDAKAVIKAKSTSKNFTGTGEVGFTIGKFDLSGEGVYAKADKATSVVFNGAQQEPPVTVTVAFSDSYGAKNIPASDYKITYVKDSVNVGHYNVVLVPSDEENGNLTGSKEVEAYDITKASLKDVTVSQDKEVPAGTELSASNFKDFFTVKLGEYTLEAGKDFTVGSQTGKWNEKDENITVKLTAVADSNFSDDYTVSYTTVAKEFAAVYVSTEDFVYNGEAHRPKANQLKGLTEKDGTATLTESDYTVVDWANNTNAGTATATIKGNGEYEGRQATVEFTIKPSPVTGTVTVTGVEPGTYYIGSEVKGGTVKVGTQTMSAEDYTITAEEFSADEAKLTKVKVTFKGNYAGEQVITLNPAVASDIASLDNATVTGEIPAGLKAYDEAAIKKYIKVAVDGTEIIDTAYNVEEIACATTGKTLGDLDSEISFRLTASEQMQGQKKNNKIKVVQRDIKELEKLVTVAGEFKYDGTEKKAEPTVDVSESDAKALVKDTDYTLSWKDNKDAGKATVVLTGKGNYKGSAEAAFDIAKADLTEDDFAVTGADKVEYTPSDVVDQSAKLSLKAATGKKYEFASGDYEFKLVAGQKAVAIGEEILYDLTIKDSKNYNAKEFKNVGVSTVITRTATDAEITAEKTTFAVEKYAGVESLGKVEVKVDGVVVPATDYEVTVEGNTADVTSEVEDKDKPEIVVTFKGGNYIGKAKLPITIVAAEINIKDVVLEAPTGSAAVYDFGDEIGVEEKDNGKDKLVAHNPSKHYYDVVYKDSNGKVLSHKDNESGETVYDVPTEAGTYTATVIATPAYGGETGNSVTYEIAQMKLSKTIIEEYVKDMIFLSDVEYMAENSKAPAVYEYGIDDEDVVSKNFEVVSFDKTWNGDDETGKAQIGTKADGNFSYDGTFEAEFDWVPGQLYGEPSDYFEIDPQTYTGKALEPALKAKDGLDVSVAWATIKYYENNVNASTKSAKAYVEVVVPDSEKKYEGGTSGYITFAIVPAEGLTVTVEDAAYTGSPVTPAVTVKDAAGAVLKEGTDYTVAYENNTYVGEGTVTVTGKGNYAGTATATFKIKEDASKVDEATKAANDAIKAAAGVTEANGYSAEDVAAVKAAADALAAVQAKDNASIKELSDATKALTDAKDKADANKAAAKAAKAAAGVTTKVGYTAADVAAVKKAADALAAAKAKSGATAAEIQAATKALNAAIAKADKNGKKAPAKVKLNKKKTKSAKKGKITVVWKKVKGVKGYQIKVGKKSYNVKSAKKVKKIVKAKAGKKFAVKVRAYKVFKGKKIYGKWSAAKKVKVKK